MAERGVAVQGIHGGKSEGVGGEDKGAGLGFRGTVGTELESGVGGQSVIPEVGPWVWQCPALGLGQAGGRGGRGL